LEALPCAASNKKLRIENEIKPGTFDEKRGVATLLIKRSGFYFIRDPKSCIEETLCLKGREDRLEEEKRGCWRLQIPHGI